MRWLYFGVHEACTPRVITEDANSLTRIIPCKLSDADFSDRSQELLSPGSDSISPGWINHAIKRVFVADFESAQTAVMRCLITYVI